MESAFLKDKLERFILLVPEEYKIAEEVKKGPKGYTVVLERVSGKKKAQAVISDKPEEKKVETQNDEN